jgi:hypothetical protein
LTHSIRRQTIDVVKPVLCTWLLGRWTILVLGLAFVCSTFATGTHWLTVPHHLCEIHGTIEHGLALAPAPVAPTPAAPIVRGNEREHEECALGPYTPTEAVLLGEAQGHGLFLAERVGYVFAPTAPTPSVPLFLLAPSRSPPV